ncbi:MAG: ABC transporter ATP-binding protein [Rubrivivax sp.]|nr:ABC transporter ATP-binding protein [Pyrinomonadaceae bacterium]
MYGALTAEREVAGEAAVAGEVLLSVDGLSKKFCRSLKRSLFYGMRDIATELIGGRRASEKLRAGEFWALRDVSCVLRRGEALGLVGSNGAGKSTLLRLISGLIKPDMGRITVRGRVAPLIALGAGFNPVLTGLENVYANMSILGLTTREVRRRLDEVLAFAEIEPDALDAPVRTYSSGMAARLGFACAVHTDPDILLIDEVLAVGDVKFRVKCYRQLARLRAAGTAFILVSHNPHAILSMCTSAVYLSKGALLAAGEVGEVMGRYEEDLFSTGAASSSTNRLKLPEKSATDSTGLDITALKFKDAGGELTNTVSSGEPVSFCVEFFARETFDDLNLALLVREQGGEGEWIMRLSTVDDHASRAVAPGRHEWCVEMPYCGLRPGRYVMKLNISQGPIYLLDAVESFNFVVGGKGMTNCSYYQPRTWKIVRGEAVDTFQGSRPDTHF